MLSPGEQPMLSSEDFLASCKDALSASEFDILENLALLPSERNTTCKTSAVEDWYVWETCLRNALVHMRTKGKAADSEKFIRPELDFFSEIEKGVQEAFGKPTPLEMENALDKLRWSRLDEMEVGHVFDFTKLCVYKLKLMLCEKLNLLDKEKGSENFDNIINHIYGEAQIAPVQIEA
jgi:hypothetical protein